MAVRNSENLVTLYPYDLMQPSDKKILGATLNLNNSPSMIVKTGITIYFHGN